VPRGCAVRLKEPGARGRSVPRYTPRIEPDRSSRHPSTHPLRTAAGPGAAAACPLGSLTDPPTAPARVIPGAPQARAGDPLTPATPWMPIPSAALRPGMTASHHARACVGTPHSAKPDPHPEEQPRGCASKKAPESTKHPSSEPAALVGIGAERGWTEFEPDFPRSNPVGRSEEQESRRMHFCGN